MAMIEARILRESEYDQWDQLVEQSDMGTIFHSSKWITTTAKNLSLDYAILGVFRDTQLIGGCCFYIKKIFHIFKIGFTEIPLSPYGGFVFSPIKSSSVRLSEETRQEIISLILEKIQTLNFFIVTLKNSPAFIDIRPFIHRGWIEKVYYTYELSLKCDNLLLSFGNTVKDNIKKSQKIGLKVKKEYNPDLFWKLIELTYQRKNINIPFQKKYFFDLTNMLHQNNLGEMWVAEMPSGDAVAATMIIYHSALEGHCWVGASDPQFKNTGAVTFLEFMVINDHKNRGFEKINMMGGNVPNLSKHYSGFNPKLMPYYSVMKIKVIGKFLDLFRW